MNHHDKHMIIYHNYYIIVKSCALFIIVHHNWYIITRARVWRAMHFDPWRRSIGWKAAFVGLSFCSPWWVSRPSWPPVPPPFPLGGDKLTAHPATPPFDPPPQMKSKYLGLLGLVESVRVFIKPSWNCYGIMMDSIVNIHLSNKKKVFGESWICPKYPTIK